VSVEKDPFSAKNQTL